MAKFKTQARRDLIAEFKTFYGDLTAQDLKSLSSIYHEEVTFIDPVMQVNGRESLQAYLEHGLSNAQSCQFVIHEEMIDAKQGFLVWQMRLQHEKLAGGIEIVVPGTTHVVFDEETNSIRHHIDYYDLGAMIYEHIPVLGWVINKVRRRLEHA
ncbi:nuclear transport factor 2 family protein [Aliidiomarina sanyensis]|uniref:Nuclear transport factor 2 family protein n=1 Tax=Aliidiomarina sanyensis TaxID=1249555 RepID=A0A432WS49_9GAMM|nr:nuclear transport factor 2 family protein [Aliidiomarina sanyensis]RUO36596.1 nuclear transport factor 2 family protein [Aliidiomarina sanyensis]